MNKIKEIFKAWNIAFDPNDEQTYLAAKRIKICNSCDKKVTNLGINRCSACGCALKGKIFSPIKGACPEGRWDSVDKVKEEKEKVLKSIKDKSIFVQIASYRDPQLIQTLDDLFIKADNPDDLTVCIAWQHSEEDEWDNLDKYKSDPRVNIIDIPHTESKGACWARNRIQQEYNNEAYTLQLDSHHRFIEGWDSELILMYEKLKKQGSKKPLITAYLPSYNPDDKPESKLNEVWKMDFNRFTPEGYIFTRPSTIQNWEQLNNPVPARFFSAHFAFTTGKHCKEVPHDPNLYFHGEEPSLASRSFTHGYDLFHPNKVIAWHFYTRENFVRHWDDVGNWAELDKESHRRFRILHKMEKCFIDEASELSKYGFGKHRTLEDYERFAGLRYRDRKVTNHTLKLNLAPYPNMDNLEVYEQELLTRFKHCIDIHRSHFNEEDYEYWVISFEMDDGSVIYREDANKEEIKRYKKEKEWIKIWREYSGEFPDKWVVWPYSKNKGFIERIEGKLNG